jgi:hypothetical protein
MTENRNSLSSTVLFPEYEEDNYPSLPPEPQCSPPLPPIQEATKLKVMETENIDILNQFLVYMKKNNPKLCILTPSYNSICSNNYTQSLLQTVNLFHSIQFSFEIMFTRNDSLVTRARNNLVAKAMSDSAMTHILFIDSDISWNPFDIIKLIISDKLLIGGIYPLKKYQWDAFTKYKGNFAEHVIDKKNGTYLKDIMTDEDAVRCNLVRYNMNFLSNKLTIDNNLIKVRHIPTGFMMIKRETIYEMINHFPETKYTDDTESLLPAENQYAYALFDCKVVEERYLSEDWYFCHRWSSLGNDIYADVSINLIHTGVEDFKGCLISNLICSS